MVLHTRPSNKPSPVVAQLGTTFHSLSCSELSFKRSETSFGVIARFRASAPGSTRSKVGAIPPLTSLNVLLICKYQQQGLFHFPIQDDSV